MDVTEKVSNQHSFILMNMIRTLQLLVCKWTQTDNLNIP